MSESLRLDGIPAVLTADEFWNLFGHVEHESLDFKRAVSGDIRQTIPAMAMTSGGLIVHGVDREHQITGCPRSQKTVDRITRIANECGVEVQTRQVIVGDLELTITAVPEVRGRIVTSPDGRLLRRVGGDSQPLRGDSLARFVRVREEHSAEDDTVDSVQPADMSLVLVNQALTADGKQPVDRGALEQALVDLGVALPPSPPLGIRVVRAGVVLFADDPGRFIPGASVQLIRRTGLGPGPGPSIDREECRGPLPDALNCCMRFIERHTLRYEAVIGSRRERIPQYPEVALREAILNALAHRDYGLVGSTVDITIWDDRIEVKSPGPLPGHITAENMRLEHYSRNRRIMRVLKTLGLVEEYGEGVERMHREMEARLMEPPIFAPTPSSVTATLRNRFLVDVEDQAWLAMLSAHSPSVEERRALVAARREGSITPRRLKEILPDVKASVVLAGAAAKGLMVRVGERGGARYQLSDEIMLRAGGHSMEAQARKRQSLLDELRRRGSLSTAEGARLLGEDTAAVRHLLNDLVQAGLARAEGRTRARRYYLGGLE